MQNKGSQTEGLLLWYESTERYYGDVALRTRVGAADPEETLAQLGITPPENMETRIVENTEDVVYFVLPPDPNAELSDESLSGVAGGATGSSAGTASTIGCFISCLGSVGSASTLGSMGA